ncbi:unnamed protein product, partial [Amoebophrya sp. A25]|eukprot:GSA25T00008941001.1
MSPLLPAFVLGFALLANDCSGQRFLRLTPPKNAESSIGFDIEVRNNNGLDKAGGDTSTKKCLAATTTDAGREVEDASCHHGAHLLHTWRFHGVRAQVNWWATKEAFGNYRFTAHPRSKFVPLLVGQNSDAEYEKVDSKKKKPRGIAESQSLPPASLSVSGELIVY